MKSKLYFNPDCSKCREAKDLLEGQSCEFEIVEYLTSAPSTQDLRDLLALLGLKALDLIRQGESLFQENYAGKTMTNEEWIAIMCENPILIERPILIHNGKAIIGRPPSKILEVL